MSLFVECYTRGRSSISVNPYGRLHVKGRYVTVSYHPYCGPEFYFGNKWFEPLDMEQSFQDELWAQFGKWMDKYRANEAKMERQGKSIYRDAGELK